MEDASGARPSDHQGMSETASVSCEKCGARNDVLVSDESFEEQLKHASFHFACRVCGADLPAARVEGEKPHGHASREK